MDLFGCTAVDSENRIDFDFTVNKPLLACELSLHFLKLGAFESEIKISILNSDKSEVFKEITMTLEELNILVPDALWHGLIRFNFQDKGLSLATDETYWIRAEFSGENLEMVELSDLSPERYALSFDEIILE